MSVNDLISANFIVIKARMAVVKEPLQYVMDRRKLKSNLSILQRVSRHIEKEARIKEFNDRDWRTS